MDDDYNKKLLTILIGVFIIVAALPTALVFSFESGNIVINTSKHLQDDIGHYLGTYSFYDDIIGNDPIDWTVDETGGAVNVIEEWNNHNHIVEMDDIDGERCDLFQFTSSIPTYGTIEFWWLSTNTTEEMRFTGNGGSGYNSMFRIQVVNGKFMYYDSGYQELGLDATNNVWYHVKINFECGIGTYDGLAQYDYNIYVDGDKFGDFDFITDEADFRMPDFLSGTGQDYKIYIDAIGYSWDTGYNIGDNLNFRQKIITVYTYLSDIAHPALMTFIVILLPIVIVIAVLFLFLEFDKLFLK